MRLGDLDALKEEVGSWGMNDYEPSDFIDAIDAAPTIETGIYITGETLNPYIDGYREGIKDYQRLLDKIEELEKEKRPKGEWIEVGDNQPYSKDKLYGCSKCRFGGYLLSDTKNVNFCPNCGAYMRGKEE